MTSPPGNTRLDLAKTIQITCACGKQLRAPNGLAGSAADCPACGASLTIPPMGVLAGTPPPPTTITLRPRKTVLVAKKTKGIGKGPILGVAIALFMVAVVGFFFLGRPDKDAETKDAVSPPSEPKKNGVADAKKPAVLAWNLQSEKPIFVEMTTDGRKSTKAQGITTVEELKQTFFFRWLPQRHQDGTWRLLITLEGCKLDLGQGIHAIHFDSVKKNHPLHRTLTGTEFEATFDADWTSVRSLTGPVHLPEKLAQAEPPLGGIFLSSLHDEALKSMLERIFTTLPGTEMLVGEQWRREATLPAGFLDGQLAAKYTYTYQGRKNGEGEDRIRVDTAMTFHYPEATRNGVIKKAKVSANQHGWLRYDAEQGRLAAAEMNFSLDGDVEMVIEDETSYVDIAITKKTSMRFGDKSFLAK